MADQSLLHSSDTYLDISKLEIEQLQPKRKHQLPCVDTAEAVENWVKDNEVIMLLNERYGDRTGILTRMLFVFVEPTRTYLRRASAVSAHTPLEAIDSNEGATHNSLSDSASPQKM